MITLVTKYSFVLVELKVVSLDRWVAKHAHRLQGHLLHPKQFNMTSVHIQTDAKQPVKKSSCEMRGGGKKKVNHSLSCELFQEQMSSHTALSEGKI